MSVAGRFIALLVGGLLSWPCLADVDDREYEEKDVVRSQKERQKLLADFEHQKRIEAEQQKIEAEQEARRLAEEKARLEVRPYPVRLTEARCTRCHGSENYEAQNHTWLGWWLVVLRMEYFNGADFGSGERGVIVSHLTEIRPAHGVAGIQEYLSAWVVLMLPVLAAWTAFYWRVRRQGIRGTAKRE